MAEIENPAELIDIVEALKNDPEQVEIRTDIATRLRQHAMTDVIWVPDYLKASGKSVIMNSPRIAELARQIGAVMASYTTTTTVVPAQHTKQTQADDVEKGYALRRDDLFTPQVTQTARWRQMIVVYDFYKLSCGDPNGSNPWSVIQPDPLSCYYLMGEESRKTMRPDLMAREYQLRIRDVDKYSDSREKKTPYRKADGTWDFKRLEDDKAVMASGGSTPTNPGASIKGQFEFCTFYEYDDGEYTYVLALDRKGRNSSQTGKIIWSRKNLTGGSSYVMVPGYMTGSTELREKWLPHLWGPMNVQYQIDVINTLRASRSMNIKPQILMERTPELLKAAQALGITRPTPDGYESLGSDTIIELDGKPHFWTLPEDKDLAALQDTKQKELENYIATELSLTQADILKDAAVRNIQLALGIRSQQQGMMLTFEAIGEREILKMWAHSITCEGGYGADDWGLFARTKVPYKGGYVQAGEYVPINKKMLDFDHHVEVGTASMSDQERQFLVQAAIERKVSKISIWPEVLDAAGYQNRQEQEENLIDEEGYEGASQYYGPWLEPVFIQRMAERQGILIPAPQPGLDEATAGGNPANLGASGNAFPSPQVEGPKSGVQPGSPQ